jgi:hypothetical protein
MKLEFSRYIFEKYSNIKFHENPSSGNQVVPCGLIDTQTDGWTDRQRDMTKVIAARYFAKAPKNIFLIAGSGSGFNQRHPK